MHSLKQTLLLHLSQLDGVTAYSTIVGLLLICGLGVPLPEDITLIAAGILSGLHKISFIGALAAGFFGVLLGDAILYTLGRIYGRRAFQLPLIRTFMTPRRIEKAERRILRNSHFICFTARFLPGLRAPIYLMAGSMGVRPLVFYGLDSLAAAISVPIWVFLGRWFGENMDYALKVAGRIQISVFIGLALLVAGYFLLRRLRRNQRAVRMKRFRTLNQDVKNPT